jgi:hypothetical protein
MPRVIRSSSIVPAFLALALLAAAGCGGSRGAAPAGRAVDPPPDRDRPPPPPLVDADGDDDDGPDDGLEITTTRGSVDPSVVSDRLAPRAAAIEDCYASRVGRRKWLGGGLELAWDVRADGTIAGVRIASSDLGAWPIEKCVLGIARGISFGKPRGDKPAEVSAPLSFTAGSGAVAWDDEQSARAVGDRLSKLASCARPRQDRPSDVTITLYLGTRGRVEAVGFASPRGFAEAWADCAERAIMAWALTDPRGKVAKLSVTYNPSAAASAGAGSDDDQDL